VQDWKSKASVKLTVLAMGSWVGRKSGEIVYHLSGFQTFLACPSTPSSTLKGISQEAMFAKIS
jgi:hypothetical protein